MLRISEVEAGVRRAGFTTVDLTQVMTHAAEFYEPLAESKDVTLLLAPEGGIRAGMAGDPSLLFEAIGNLLDNAIKFTSRGGRVVVRNFHVDDSLGVAVSDTAPTVRPGLDPDGPLRVAIQHLSPAVFMHRHAVGSCRSAMRCQYVGCRHWLALMPNTHEGYVGWEEAKTIRRMVSSYYGALPPSGAGYGLFELRRALLERDSLLLR